MPQQANDPGAFYRKAAADSAPATQELIAARPEYWVRKGSLVVLCILLLIVGAASLIRYPDTLEGPMVLTSDPLPVKLKAQAAGRIARLFVADNGPVQPGDPIAVIENNTGFDNIRLLAATADTVLHALERNALPALERTRLMNLQALGDAQTIYNQLLQQVSAYLLLEQQHIFAKRGNNLQEQHSYYRRLTAIGDDELSMINEELRQAKERFAANEKLYRDQVISRQEYFDESERWRQKQLSLEQQRRAREQNNIAMGTNDKQLFELNYERSEKEQLLLLGIEEQVRNLQNFVQGWRLKYLLTAPYAGKVCYLKPLQVNETVGTAEELVAIVPDQFRYMAYAALPASGIGKIKEGQGVHLLLDHYPYNEYGYIIGTVRSLTALPQSNNNAGTPGTPSYRVYIRLPDSLVTTYHRPLHFSAEMSGTARIITKDRSLLQRLLANVARLDR
jgi:HlyD family secretion protein